MNCVFGFNSREILLQLTIANGLVLGGLVEHELNKLTFDLFHDLGGDKPEPSSTSQHQLSNWDDDRDALLGLRG